jgi:predicted amidophosphoribosyltransferase
MTEPSTPVCIHCFMPFEVGDDFCPHCGKPVGEATQQMPFIPGPAGKESSTDDENDSGDSDE